MLGELRLPALADSRELVGSCADGLVHAHEDFRERRA